jgi:tryptophan synthase alpha chain
MAALKKEGRPALVLYLTFGDPSPARSVAIIEAAIRGGADVIELGVPFSDPNADGVVIQEAMQRALAGGATMDGALACVRELRGRGVDTPIVLFGYYNPIFVRGVDAFARDARDSGVDAVLTVDLPIDELEELHGPLKEHGVDVVPLVAPTSTPTRIARVATIDPPFVYYISRTGITGSEFKGSAGGDSRINEIRKVTGAPVCVGFGIKTTDDARRVGALADGVVVGSAAVQCIHDAGPDGAPQALEAFVRSLRSVLGSRGV